MMLRKTLGGPWLRQRARAASRQQSASHNLSPVDNLQQSASNSKTATIAPPLIYYIYYITSQSTG